jgi:hypothetical protein
MFNIRVNAHRQSAIRGDGCLSNLGSIAKLTKESGF